MSIFNDEYQTDDEFVIPFEDPRLPDSKWFFAKEPTLADTQYLRKLEVELEQHADADEEEQALEKIRGYLKRMGRRFEGPAYRVDENFKTKDGKKHPLAGKMPPANGEFVDKIPSRYCLAAYVWLVNTHAALRRSDTDEESFRGGSEDLDGSTAAEGTVSPADES